MSRVNPLGAIESSLEQAGFAQQGLELDGLSLRELRMVSIIRIYALPGQPAQVAEFANLPAQTGEVRGSDPATLCLRPCEWLVFSQTRKAEVLLRDVPSGSDHPALHAWDESDGLGVLRVAGRAAPWTLRKLCGLEFPFDRERGINCAQTRFGHISVLMHEYVGSSGIAYHLFVDRSLARYTWELLANAAPHAVELGKAPNVTDPGRP